MTDAMTLDRCVCFDVQFAELKTIAETHAVDSVEGLQAHADFGHNCTLCRPYVRRMLATGETVFHEIVTDTDEPT